MKTFEEKKQELLNEIFHYTGGATREIFTKMVNELIPPKPPTCSTCKHADFYGVSNQFGYCNSENDNNTDVIEITRYFGCIHHSDFSEE